MMVEPRGGSAAAGRVKATMAPTTVRAMTNLRDIRLLSRRRRGTIRSLVGLPDEEEVEAAVGGLAFVVVALDEGREVGAAGGPAQHLAVVGVLAAVGGNLDV